MKRGDEVWVTYRCTTACVEDTGFSPSAFAMRGDPKHTCRARVARVRDGLVTVWLHKVPCRHTRTERRTVNRSQVRVADAVSLLGELACE